MKIDLPFDEALALAASGAPLPDLIASLTCSGSTIRAELDLREITATSATTRFALAAAGTVTVTARLDGYADGIAEFVVTAHARGLPAHRLIPYLLDPIESAIARAGLPDGLVTVARGDSDPVVAIDLQKALASRTSGLTITALTLVDAVIHAEAEVGEFRAL